MPPATPPSLASSSWMTSVAPSTRTSSTSAGATGSQSSPTSSASLQQLSFYWRLVVGGDRASAAMKKSSRNVSIGTDVLVVNIISVLQVTRSLPERSSTTSC